MLGDRVVAWFGSAGAMCVDRKGNELWTNRDLPFEGIHGVAASPMPAAGRIIISSGQPKAPPAWLIRFSAKSSKAMRSISR